LRPLALVAWYAHATVVAPEFMPQRKRRFNTAGPCDPRWHYLLPPLPRVPSAWRHAESGDYFVLHAPRQSGKTTFLRAFARALTESGRCVGLYSSCEAAEAKGDDDVAAQELLVARLEDRIVEQLPEDLRPPPFVVGSAQSRLRDFLAHWATHSPRPVVLLLDEIDALRGNSLISVLRQLRESFPERPQRAPWSVVLCGLRDVREYKTASGGDGARLGTASPFNIKVASLTLAAFTSEEIATLLAQHTAETGQAFEPAAIDRVVELTAGQPWLVNALAREVVEELGVTETISVEHVDQAKERLILARATHLDSLAARLSEPRVRRVLQPLVAGESVPADLDFDDDADYVADLGLVARAPLRIANPIYREVIARILCAGAQDSVLADPRAFVRPDGRFDLDVLLREFAAFWIEQGKELADHATYREVGAQLVLMAFLQRVVNGGGTVTREYGLGMRRIDLLVTWPFTDADGKRQLQREALELKVWHHGKKDPLEEGLRQLDNYLARLGLDAGVLVIFDRRKRKAPLEERVREAQATTASGRRVRVLRA
jgi:hypothetical protein